MKINRKQLEKQFEDFLNVATNQIPKEAIKNMERAVNIVYRTARARRAKAGKSSAVGSPFGVPVVTGVLKESIKKEVKQEGSHVIGRIWQDSSEAPYGKRVEFGFVGKDSLGRTYHQEPRPYMRPAFDINKELINKFIKGK